MNEGMCPFCKNATRIHSVLNVKYDIKTFLKAFKALFGLIFERYPLHAFERDIYEYISKFLGKIACK